MTPFTTLAGRACVLDQANIDTDQIIPARFLRMSRADGYGGFLFADLRRADNDFPVRPGCAVLLAGENFGCGSSREGAVYALLDAGIRCVIAPSFGDIFAGNAAQNGLLTIAMAAPDIAALRTRLAANPALSVDLPAQRLRLSDGSAHAFAIDAYRKRMLVEGLDDIGLTLSHAADLAAFEARDRVARPWATPGPGGH